MSIKVNSARKEIELLNNKYRSRELISNEFYRQFERRGIDIKTSVLVSLIPDGDNTYFGKVLDQSGKAFSFDIDLDDASYSIWHEVTSQFYKDIKNQKSQKPWSLEVVAFEFGCFPSDK